MMEWENLGSSSNGGEGAAEEERNVEADGGGGGGVLYVKVMTDEQMEVLRHQIAAYATICERLVEMHKAASEQNQTFNGMRLGSLYCDTLMTNSGNKVSSRPRWTPTPVQLQILENIFNKGNGTPSRQKITEITSELAQHGQISESNVYNWFQNRRARSKRKQAASVQNNAESEIEMEAAEYSNEKKSRPDHTRNNENHPLQGAEISSHTRFLSDTETMRVQGPYQMYDSSRSPASLARMSFNQNTLSNPRVDHLLGRMELSGGFSPFRPGEGYDMLG